MAYIALCWDCHIHQQRLLQSHSVLRKSTFAIRQAAARLSPSGGTKFQTTCFPVSFGKSFMKIRSAVPENGCLIRRRKKNKKTSVKHIRYRLIGGCVNEIGAYMNNFFYRFTFVD